MIKVKVMGKIDVFETIRFNMPSLPKKKRTRSLKTIRRELKKTERILAI